MKKTLLLISVTILLSIGLNAQEWNFGNDSVTFPTFSGLKTGETRLVNGLLITAGGSGITNMGQVEVSPKTFGTTTYRRRFKFNNAGYTPAASSDLIPPVNMPTQRYISFEVIGNSTITMHAYTGTASDVNSRKIFITDGVNLITSITLLGNTPPAEEVIYNYTGPAKTLYMFGNASFNLYYLKVTSPFTGVKLIPSDNGVSFNGTRILNEKGLKLEVYNTLGKLITRSSATISTSNFPKGVYVVRISGSNAVLKFSK